MNSGDWSPFRYSTVLPLLLTGVCLSIALGAGESRFSQTNSSNDFVHRIDLYDANDRVIDPTSENPPPYSPMYTCGRCHNYEAIAAGHHFNAIMDIVPPGRPGEPWIWTDETTGTQLPLSYRGWPGTYDPRELGISSRDFVQKFGRQLPGGGPGEVVPSLAEGEKKKEETSAEGDKAKDAKEKPSEAAIEANRWKLSGLLNVDCMICHGVGHTFSHEAWWEQIQRENFAWASTAALGLAEVDGDVSKLPDDFAPDTAEADSRHKLPATTYEPGRINLDKKVFFDVVRKPTSNACYYCHSTHRVGEGAPPEWTEDEDVHLRAGFVCADCHSNGIGHNTVRGYEGERNPSGVDVETLSCRGCHMNQGHGGGRMGAPQPLHAGLPPLHFEKLSCTACHSGPKVAGQAELIQTSMANGLGLLTHETGPRPPAIVEPVFLRDDGLVYPHRAFWPAFWGQMSGETIKPLNPDAVYDATRRTLRVRKGSNFAESIMEVRLSSTDKKEILGEERYNVKDEELTDEEREKVAAEMKKRGLENWQEKLPEALAALKEIVTEEGAEPVFVSGGKVYKLAGEDGVETFEHSAAKPYAWAYGHNVRPARYSLGVKGCYECHALDADLFDSKVAASGQAPEQEPAAEEAMYELAGFDKMKLDAWAVSFMGRTAFKYFAFASMGVVALVLLAYGLRAIVAICALGRRS